MRRRFTGREPVNLGQAPASTWFVAFAEEDPWIALDPHVP